MSEIILGKDIIAHREDIDLIPEFFEIIDPEGANVIIDKESMKEGILCHCLFKFVNQTEPVEASVLLSKKIFKRIVLTFDIASILEVN